MSRKILIVLVVVMSAVHFFYFPKWQKANTEATISWDVSGYYMYLPAIFIHHDIKKCTFLDEVLQEYHPTPDLQQAFIHEGSGNYVMKYSLGQSIVMSPYFFIGHAWASLDSDYKADGFTFPYQFSVGIGMLLFGLFGLLILRLVLLEYFGEVETSIALVGIVIGSNYLNYAAIDGAMTHNSLFTIYSLLLYATIQFYKTPKVLWSLSIGFLVGLAALIRPTEIIAIVIPLFWGLKGVNKKSIIERIQLYWEYKNLLIGAVLLTGAIGSLQLFYWHYVTGDWIVYSYQDQGFSWLKPHLFDGIFSYKSGWLTYSPFMVFSMVGFYHLYNRANSNFLSCLTFAGLFIYIAFAWDIWWYGGSLGQRTMVQAYPVLAFPLAAFFGSVLTWKRWQQCIIGVISLLFVYMSLWFTHQAHKGGLLPVGQMNKYYYWKTLLTYEKNVEDLKLLDVVKEIYDGEPKDLTLLVQDTVTEVSVNQSKQYGEEFNFTDLEIDKSMDWVRVSAEFEIVHKEWDFWRMTQFIVKLKKGDELVSDKMIRVQRLLDGDQKKRLYIDIAINDLDFDSVIIHFWNADGTKELKARDVRVELFKE